MKKVIAIWIISALTVGTTLSQQVDSIPEISLQFTNITLKNALDSLALKYNLRLSYSDSKINSGRIVSGNYAGGSIHEFLLQFLKDQDLNYTIIDDQIVIFPFKSNQTIKITGRVTSAEDGAPVAFASIALPDIAKGTSTNEDGEFELDVTELPLQIMVSHIAFEKKLVFVFEDHTPLEIQLKTAPRQLKGITVKSRRDKNAYYQLLKNARILITDKLDEAQYGKAFYRQKSERQSRYTEIFEMFYDVKYTRNGIEDWALQEGRYAFQNKDEYDVFLYNKNFTQLSRMFTILQPETENYLLPFHPEAKTIFELSLQEIIEHEGRHIAIINYRPLASVDKPAPYGQIFIDFETSDVFKVTGTFTDPGMNIIGFSDSESSWDDYHLTFDISFGENEAGSLVLDYIRVDHYFNYYFKKEFIGKIHTSSFLNLYEHYVPSAAKKLGGPVDFKDSDAETIDRIGYNREFWLQNPIVKRTPLEEKLILDFDKNEAFGVVFMNQEEQVMLLPDRKNSEKAKRIIETYESATEEKPEHRIYLRLDKKAYIPGDKIRFGGYIVNTWSLRPSATGSVLNVSLADDSGFEILTKSFDINHGATYGEIDLTGISPGSYDIHANLNSDTFCLYNKQLTILPNLKESSENRPTIQSTKISKVIIAPEDGILLANLRTKVIVAGFNESNDLVPASWILTDDSGALVSMVESDVDGIGECFFSPQPGKNYFIQQNESVKTVRWPLSSVRSEGISIIIEERGENSLRVAVRQEPVFPKEVFVLSVASGKVFSVYEKRLSGMSTTIDLPTQHLPSGINELILTDVRGTILASCKFFIEPAVLNFQQLSAAWKSRKNHKLELTFKVTDMFGEPVQANLSAIYGSVATSVFGDMTTSILLEDSNIPMALLRTITKSNMGEEVDKLLLLTNRVSPEETTTAEMVSTSSVIADSDSENKIIAEVAVSSVSTAQQEKVGKESDKKILRDESTWLPKLIINQGGTIDIDCRATPGTSLAISIEGLSIHGEIADFNAVIDLESLKDKGTKKGKWNK